MNLLLRCLAVAGLWAASQLFAVTAFEGRISFSMTAEKGHTLPMDYSMKGQKQRIDMSAEGHEVSTIMDPAKLEMTMLMHEQKMYMVMPLKGVAEKASEAAEKYADPDVDVESTGKTEKILGHTCNQILVTEKKRRTVTELWLAPDLGMFMGLGNNQGGGGGMFGHKSSSATAAKWEEALKGKAGFPLRVVTRDTKGKETYRMEATKVEPGSLPDSLFAPPAGYQKFQMPDFGSLNPFKKKS
jgi:hypothetical protein